MNLKRKYLKNVPWLRNVNNTVIQHILEEVNILRVSEQGFILKKGEKCDKAFIIIEGTASVYVHVGKEDIKEKFSNLNTGSCFNVFSFLNPDGIQLTSFIADDFCVLLTISRKQIEELENRFY